MGQNRRYAAQVEALQDARIAALEPGPITLPLQAYGGPVEWHLDDMRPVWVWLSYRHKPAERVAAMAEGWTDRVVLINLMGEGGTRTVTVWRSAVSVRRV